MAFRGPDFCIEDPMRDGPDDLRKAENAASSTFATATPPIARK